MRTAWVLPGGSTFGAIQAGLVSALFEAGSKPDSLIGTSAGSLNAAWLAAYPSERGAERLRALWHSMRRPDVFPIQPLRILAAKLGLSNHLMSNTGLARWLHSILPYRRLENARIPLTVTATDVDSGEAVYFDRGPILPALVASCSIPGMFPPIQVDGRWLVDGGPSAYMPISRAVEQGAERVYVLPCGGTKPFSAATQNRPAKSNGARRPARKPPKSIGGINGVALEAAMVHASRLDMQLNSTRCELYIVPAPSVIGLSPYSFSQSDALIDAAWRIAKQWLPIARPVPSGPVDLMGNSLPSTVGQPSVREVDLA